MIQKIFLHLLVNYSMIKFNKILERRHFTDFALFWLSVKDLLIWKKINLKYHEMKMTSFHRTIKRKLSKYIWLRKVFFQFLLRKGAN